MILDGFRSPRGKGKPTGSLHGVHPQELLAQVLNHLVKQTGINSSEIEDVIIGNNENAGDHGSCIARMAVLAAGWGHETPGVTLNRFCGSGQQAVNFAAMSIGSGQHDVVVAGGVESMSRWGRQGRLDFSAGNAKLLERHPLVPQGVSADLIASLEGFSRTDLDEFAVRSQRLAAVAQNEGRFQRSLVPIRHDDSTLALDHDEHPRPATTVEMLAELPPSFERQGTRRPEDGGRTFDEMCADVYPELTEMHHLHHAGNSSGIVDGASAILLGSEEFAVSRQVKPRGRVVATAVAGAEPVIMLTAPAPAARKCLARAGMTVADIDLWEINEAFAAIPLKTIRDLDLDIDRVNVNGGAIALGHPIGATGAMLIQTALDELERQDKQTALVVMCTGGGMATASVIERV